MNAIVLSILIVMILSLSRVPVVMSLIIASVVGGMHAGMSPENIVSAFNKGLGGGAPVALAMATLGAFAVMLSRTGIAQKISTRIIGYIEKDNQSHTFSTKVTVTLYIVLILVGFSSGTIVPVHIAYIPVLIPPLLVVINHLQLDRRAVACVITFSLSVMYLTSPIGYGNIFQNEILTPNINLAGQAVGFSIERGMAAKAMLIPVSGLCVGLLFALLVTYRKKRVYEDRPIQGDTIDDAPASLSRWQIAGIIVALLGSLAVQLWSGSMVFGGLAGFAVLSACGIVKWSEQDSVFTQGVRMMAFIGFIMIAASGFAEVMKATGAISQLVQDTAGFIGDSKPLAAAVMLVVGLLVTMGIGSSFSTVPIIAAIYVPLCVSFEFSAMATVALIGTAAALGDAGSPASDTTLGPTAGLNADGQHDHMWDTVVPTFIHFAIPLMVFGWLAAMVL
jgi:predicted histidine transporter YuiF (NhaC family)